jgi:gas vesicle structural protein
LSDADEPLVLSDLISRVLDKGVVLSGDVVISIADIDLIKLELHLLLSGVESTVRRLNEP